MSSMMDNSLYHLPFFNSIFFLNWNSYKNILVITACSLSVHAWPRPLCSYLQLSDCIMELIFQNLLIKLLFIGYYNGLNSFMNLDIIYNYKTPLTCLSQYNFQPWFPTHHICNFIFFPSNSIVLILKSIPAKKKRFHIIYKYALLRRKNTSIL